MKRLLYAAAGATVAAHRRQLDTDGSCYTMQAPVSSLEEAEDHCLSIGGHVAYTTDSNLFEMLHDFVLNGTVEEGDSWWLGLTSGKNCQFSALDDTQSIKFTNWADGEPDGCTTCTGGFDTDDDKECCVQVTEDGSWNDINCDAGVGLLYFCETETCEEECTTEHDCNARGGYPANGMCYTLQDAESSAIDAEATCAALGGHIAFSSDGDLLQAMNEFALETTQDTWWLGLNAQDGCKFVELDGTEMRYTNWADGEPNGCDSCDGAFNEDGECCVHVYTDGTWNDIDCVTDTPLAYFCEVPLCVDEATTTASSVTDGEINPCLENGEEDDDCCAIPSSAGCIDGYTYSYDDSEDGICYRGDWRAYTTICTECVDAYDVGTMEPPWYDFVSCEKEQEFCETNSDIRAGCAATCGSCGESGHDALETTSAADDDWVGRARLSYVACEGCEDFYTAVEPEFDWEACFDAGMSLRLSEDYLKIIFDEDACHQSMNPGPKEYTKFSEHSVGVQILDSDDDSDLAIYLFLTANAGDGTVQMLWNIVGLDAQFVLEFTIARLEGTFLGWDEIPDGESPPLSNGHADVTLDSYVDDNDDDDVNFCGTSLEAACATLEDTMRDGDWTIYIYDGEEVYVSLPDSCLESYGVSDDDIAKVYDSIYNINGATFVTLADNTMTIYIGEPLSQRTSMFFVDLSSGAFCVYRFTVDLVDGTFLGMADASADEVYDPACALYSCNGVSCEDWRDLGFTQDYLEISEGCEQCGDCFDEENPCAAMCGEATCADMLQNGHADTASARCSECEECFAYTEGRTTTDEPMIVYDSTTTGPCVWWSCTQ